MIYFLQPIAGGAVKIGYSVDVEARHRQLENHYGQRLALLATMAGGPEEETAVHDRFAHLRIAGKGRRGGFPEQFRPAPELMAFIGRPLLAHPDPDAVAPLYPAFVRIGIKATPEWSEWLARAAKHFRTTSAGLIDRALAEWTAAQGFKEAPPERVP